MWNMNKFYEKVSALEEGGSHYCSKKSDDICGSACDEVRNCILLIIYVCMCLCDYIAGICLILGNVWFCDCNVIGLLRS